METSELNFRPPHEDLIRQRAETGFGLLDTCTYAVGRPAPQQMTPFDGLNTGATRWSAAADEFRSPQLIAVC